MRTVSLWKLLKLWSVLRCLSLQNIHFIFSDIVTVVCHVSLNLFELSLTAWNVMLPHMWYEVCILQRNLITWISLSDSITLHLCSIFSWLAWNIWYSCEILVEQSTSLAIFYSFNYKHNFCFSLHFIFTFHCLIK